MVLLGFVAGCLRAAVTLNVQPDAGTPRDAKVTIDEEFVGLLGFVAAHGVRTIEREGYFPYDEIVVSDRQPIHLNVTLQKLPD
jgi:hypothetical protein